MNRPLANVFSLINLRRVLVVGAAGVALYAEKLTAEERLRTGGTGSPPLVVWQLFALAALLFAAGAWPTALRGGLPGPWGAALRRQPRLRPALALGAAAIVLALATIPLFMTINGTPVGPVTMATAQWGWPIWIVALLLFGVAFAVWEWRAPAPSEGRSADATGDHLPARVEWAIMAGLLVVAGALRLWNLDNVPPGLWFDEAQNGMVGLNLLDPGAIHPTFISNFTQMGALPFYFFGLVLKVTGTLVWPLRLLPALAGALIAPLLYLLGARLYGWRVGLAAGGLVAVSAWNLTFSRFGIVSLMTVAVDVAVYLCAAQALRTGRLGYYAGAGVLLGLALQTYYAARLVPFVLIALLLHQLVSSRGRIIRTAGLGLLIFALGALLAFLPVGLFALQQPAAFNGRINDVSVFNPAVNGGNPNAFSTSLNQHLLMFNFHGDSNGRHNLPGAPMLDDITAALFFLGLGACLLRAWRWQYAFPVLWFASALSGGVLSLPFEAPQSHRTLENSVVTALLAGIVVGELWALLTRVRLPADVTEADLTTVAVRRPLRAAPTALARTTLPTRRHIVTASTATVAAVAGDATATPLTNVAVADAPAPTVAGDGTSSELLEADGTVLPDSPSAPTPVLVPVPARVVPQRRLARRLGWAVSAAGILLLIGGVASLTLPRYFQVQANARAVFEEMYTPQAQAGREAAAAAPTDELYITPGYINLPTLRYLAPAAQPIQWQGMEQLPLPDHGHPVTVILDPPLAADMASFQKFYPHAQIVPFHAPYDAEALVYTIHIPQADISAVRGVRAGLRTAGAPAPTDQTLPGFAFDWGAAGKPGTVRLAATLQVPSFGPYTFQWNPAGQPGPDSLRVDGYRVSASQPITLGMGLHTLVATDTVQTANGRAELLWAPAGAPPQALPSTNLYDPRRVEPRGLTGLYRSGPDTRSPPVNGHVDRVVSYYFHNTVLGRPYNVDWLGKLYIPTTGTYALGTEQISRAEIWLDGTQIVTNSQPNVLVETSLNLTAGLHDIRVHYADLDPYSHMYLYWTPPGYPRSIIPAAFLLPQQGSYPATPESGPWPTLAESQARRPVEGVAPPPPSNLPPAAAVPPAAPAVAGTPLPPRLLLGSDAPLLHPRGGAVDSAGNYYIFTELDSKIHKFGPDGKALTTWDVVGKDGKPLVEGSDMFLRANQLYVLDAGASDLLIYRLDGKAADPLHLCECFNPRSITPSADGNYWLADTGNNRLVKISTAGKTITTLGAKGSNPGQFAEPAGVSEGSDGTLYVSDNGNHRIQSFSAQGSPLANWDVGESIARDGDRVLAESGGTVLVSQVAGQALVRYDKSGKELGRWVYTRNGAVLIPGVLAPAKDGVLVMLLRDNVAGVFAP